MRTVPTVVGCLMLVAAQTANAQPLCTYGMRDDAYSQPGSMLDGNQQQSAIRQMRSALRKSLAEDYGTKLQALNDEFMREGHAHVLAREREQVRAVAWKDFRELWTLELQVSREDYVARVAALEERRKAAREAGDMKLLARLSQEGHDMLAAQQREGAAIEKRWREEWESFDRAVRELHNEVLRFSYARHREAVAALLAARRREEARIDSIDLAAGFSREAWACSDWEQSQVAIGNQLEQRQTEFNAAQMTAGLGRLAASSPEAMNWDEELANLPPNQRELAKKMAGSMLRSGWEAAFPAGYGAVSPLAGKVAARAIDAAALPGTPMNDLVDEFFLQMADDAIDSLGPVADLLGPDRQYGDIIDDFGDSAFCLDSACVLRRQAMLEFYGGVSRLFSQSFGSPDAVAPAGYTAPKLETYTESPAPTQEDVNESVGEFFESQRFGTTPLTP